MSIIALDHEIRSRPLSHSGPRDERRISAVTKAKLEQKEKKMQMKLMMEMSELNQSNRSSPKRRRIRSLTRVYEGNNYKTKGKESSTKGIYSVPD